MSTKNLASQEKQARHDAVEVARLIRSNAAVTRFFTELLRLGGADKSPFSPDALQMAHDAGMISLINTSFDPLEEADPALRGFLLEQLRAKQNEQQPREDNDRDY